MQTYDLHTHSKFSLDCSLEPEKIIRIAQKKRLSGIAVTDHNTIRGGVEVKKLAEDLHVIVGCEVKTDKGEIIGYNLNEEIKSREPFEVIDEIKSQGGIVCIPHPFDTVRKFAMRAELLNQVVNKVDLIEGCNGRSLRRFNNAASRYAQEHKIPVIGGSDAHFAFEIGDCVTLFPEGKISLTKPEGTQDRSYLIQKLFCLSVTKLKKVLRL